MFYLLILLLRRPGGRREALDGRCSSPFGDFKLLRTWAITDGDVTVTIFPIRRRVARPSASVAVVAAAKAYNRANAAAGTTRSAGRPSQDSAAAGGEIDTVGITPVRFPFTGRPSSSSPAYSRPLAPLNKISHRLGRSYQSRSIDCQAITSPWRLLSTIPAYSTAVRRQHSSRAQKQPPLSLLHPGVFDFQEFQLSSAVDNLRQQNGFVRPFGTVPSGFHCVCVAGTH